MCGLNFQIRLAVIGLFIDYYSSISKSIKEPLKIDKDVNLIKRNELIRIYTVVQIDLLPLLSSAPFNIKEKYFLALGNL